MSKISIDTLSKLKTNTIVAFKCRNTDEWYTGYIQYIHTLRSQLNNNTEYFFSICINSPVPLQWANDNKAIYTYNDITSLIILEN